MNARRPALPPLSLIILAALALLPGDGHAQKLYKCQKDGKVIFSNKPCTGTAGSVESSSPLQSKVTTLAGPAPGRSYSADDKELLARIQKDLPGLTAQCEGGDLLVCAILDCVLKDDRTACARAEGRLSGDGWRERSRKEVRMRRNDPRLGSVEETELEIVIECVPGPAVQRIYWTAEGKALLRDGGRAAGRNAAKTPSLSVRHFATIEEAAAAACGVGRTKPGPPPSGD